jgi:hypothetical protein
LGISDRHVPHEVRRKAAPPDLLADEAVDAAVVLVRCALGGVVVDDVAA